MGQVYRARDTKLGRDVAIKVLPESFAQDPDRLARFEREARALASLNHPHIAQIYGLETQDGRDVEARRPVIVMELVDGATLAERIARGPLKVADALAIARQIADALDAAHERGIVHRDLKPSNIALTPEAAVKLLDFGLATDARTAQPLGASDLTHSPTMLSPTVSGVLLGTAPYMSPEQARGKPVDKRTDIWAFGCVLFEMLTGRAAFAGETTTDTIAAILEREPDWRAVPETTPPAVQQTLRQCLEKSPKRRLRDIGDVRLDAAVPSEAPPSGVPAPIAWLLALAAAIALAAAVWFARSNRAATLPAWSADTVTLAIDSAAPASGDASFPTSNVAVSRDGRFVAWVAANTNRQSTLWLYSLASGESKQLPGTTGAANPFWSPDGRAIGFQSGGNVRTIDIETGSIRSIASNPEVSVGGTWSADNVIVFSTRYTIERVSLSGGDRQVVARLNPEFQENSLRYPRFLPDGRHFLYVARSGRAQKSGSYVASIDPNSKPIRLFTTTSHVEYAAPGYLVYVSEGQLVARTFDLRTLTVGAETSPIVNHIEASSGGMSGQFDLSENGVLAYLQKSTLVKAVLQWYDRSGRPLGAAAPADAYATFRVAPDDRRVAIDLASEQNVVRDVWVLNPDQTRTRVTFGGSDDWQPFWSPDGKTLAFMSYRNGVADLFAKSLAGAVPEQPLLPSNQDRSTDDQRVSGDWSADGKRIAYWLDRTETRGDIWVQSLDGGPPVPLARTPHNERRPRFSPDGRFVAYESDESGANEIFVQPFPPTGGKWQVSSGGGSEVAWRGDGRELYYVDRDGMLLAIPVTLSAAGFSTGSAVRLFSLGRGATGGGTIRFDAARDGQRFLIRDVIDPPRQPIMLVLNWQSRLTRH